VDIGVKLSENVNATRVLLNPSSDLEMEALRAAVCGMVNRFAAFSATANAANFEALQIPNATRKPLTTSGRVPLPTGSFTWEDLEKDYKQTLHTAFLTAAQLKVLSAGDLFQMFGLGAGVFFNGIGTGQSNNARRVLWGNVLHSNGELITEKDMESEDVDKFLSLRSRIGYLVATQQTDDRVIENDAGVPFHVAPALTSADVWNDDAFEINLGYGFGPADYLEGANYRAMLCMAEAIVAIIRDGNTPSRNSIGSLLDMVEETTENTWSLSYTEFTGSAAWGIIAAALAKNLDIGANWGKLTEMLEPWGKDNNVFNKAPSANMVLWLMDIFRLAVFMGVFGKRLIVAQDSTALDVRGTLYKSDDVREPVNAAGTFENNDFCKYLYERSGTNIADNGIPWSNQESKPIDKDGNPLKENKAFFTKRPAVENVVHVVDRCMRLLSLSLEQYGIHKTFGGDVDMARLHAFSRVDTLHQDFISTVQMLVLGKVGGDVLRSGEMFDADLYEAYVKKICTQNATKGIPFFAEDYRIYLQAPSPAAITAFKNHYKGITAIHAHPGVVLHTSHEVPSAPVPTAAAAVDAREELRLRMKASLSRTTTALAATVDRSASGEVQPTSSETGISETEKRTSRDDIEKKMRARLSGNKKADSEVAQHGVEGPLKNAVSINMKVEPSEEERAKILEKWEEHMDIVHKGMQGEELAEKMIACCKMIRFNGGTLQACKVDLKKAMGEMKTAAQARKGLTSDFVRTYNRTLTALKNVCPNTAQ